MHGFSLFIENFIPTEILEGFGNSVEKSNNATYIKKGLIYSLTPKA